MCLDLKNLFKRLISDGLTDQIESQILAMSTHLIEMQRTRSQNSANQINNESPGKLCLSEYSCISKMVTLDSNITDGNDNNVPSGAKSLYTNSTTSSYKYVLNIVNYCLL